MGGQARMCCMVRLGIVVLRLQRSEIDSLPCACVQLAVRRRTVRYRLSKSESRPTTMVLDEEYDAPACVAARVVDSSDDSRTAGRNVQ